MDLDRLHALLESVRSGETQVEDAVARLRDLPYEDLGFARLDHHRSIRTGDPEVIYCPGKTPAQIIAIAERLSKRARKVLATRATPELAGAVCTAFPGSIYYETARILVIPGLPDTDLGTPGHEQLPIPSAEYPIPKTILVTCAGTSDLPVAEEAAITASELGSCVERLYDVGVAGLHRVLDRKESLFNANVIIVVAGMEGALASVVGGLVSRPVIAVPTSVGYGSSFEGLAALLAMLNTCASGVAVMNIDNGFGAGYFAHIINRG